MAKYLIIYEDIFLKNNHNIIYFLLMINGEQVEAAGKTLSDYLKEAGYDTRGIAVERNGEVIPRSRYDSTILKDGDQVELVHCVAGG